MDIKTVIQLLADGVIEPHKAIDIIANECEIEPVRLETLFNIKTSASVRYTPEEIDKVVAMWREGHSKGAIAKALGRDRISVTNLISRLRRQGIDLPLRPLDHLASENTQLRLF